jgi:hypothetical protein
MADRLGLISLGRVHRRAVIGFRGASLLIILNTFSGYRVMLICPPKALSDVFVHACQVLKAA